MPVLEADFLKGLIDPLDRLHQASLNVLRRVQEREWVVSASAFLELDLVLKHSRLGFNERFEVFEALKTEIRPDRVVSIASEVISQAIKLQSKYHNMKDFYFDSIHLAVAPLHDGVIVTGDRAFDQVAEVRRIPLCEAK